MVSQRSRPPAASRARPPAASRDRLLRAAAEEFAARGFDGAKVERIATRARVNKAMLYYHFRNKAALYSEILTELFSSLAAALTAPHTNQPTGQPGTDALPPTAQPTPAPTDRLRRFIATVSAETSARPHFPAIWLREMAEGGRHLDRTIVAELARILEVLSAILRDGEKAGAFVPAHPLVTQMGIIAPLLLFSASAPIRAKFAHLTPPGLLAVAREDVVAYVERATLAALTTARESQSRSKRRQRL
jgi:TetR/AcrR family transcriptional regulator